MGKSIAKKILESRLVAGDLSSGGQIAIAVDQTLWSDLTGIMGGQILENVGAEKVITEPTVFYVDHNTLATSTENADDHLYLRTIARRYGIYYSKPGNGICHSLHLQRFAVPGRVLLGADSHTPTSGALGMLAIGAGGLSVAKCMLGESFRMVLPKILKIELRGELRPGVSAKDLALESLRQLTVKGAIGYIIEFAGAGVKTLSVPQRATIANMSIEMGATTGIFPSDATTLAFMKGQGREADWRELLPDPDAEYNKSITIDMSRLESLAARPHMPDLVSAVRTLGGVAVSSVFIGSCTNASFSDISKAAAILKGRKVAQSVELTVAPGSRQVLAQLIASGALADLTASGARLLECACGPCIGIGQAPAAKGVAVRTSNRNFPGRSGTVDASVYLTGPETAAATALTGTLTDSRDVFDAERLRACVEPEYYPVDDGLFIPPVPVVEALRTEIIRGSGITFLPEFDPLDDFISAVVAIKLGDNITTDDIIPGGSSILKFIADIPRFAEYVFHYVDPSFVERAKSLEISIIVGGENYGQGSSREHAALLPRFLGVKAVIAKSYARIHKENLINYGMLPLVLKNPNDYALIEVGDSLEIADVHAAVESGAVSLRVPSKGLTIAAALELSDYDRRVILSGGAVNYLRENLGSV
ncbi:MAG: aconitate hydratase [Treponemataceae bacterium]